MLNPGKYHPDNTSYFIFVYEPVTLSRDEMLELDLLVKVAEEIEGKSNEEMTSLVESGLTVEGMDCTVTSEEAGPGWWVTINDYNNFALGVQGAWGSLSVWDVPLPE